MLIVIVVNRQGLMRMKLQELLQALKIEQDFGGVDPEIVSIEADSRQVKQGSLFICISGYTVDGHDFAKKAEQLGAVAIIAERQLPEISVPVVLVQDTKRMMAMITNYFYDHPTKKLTLIGVTGTNGKTTVTHLIEQIMSDDQKQTGLIGTMYMKVGEKTIETKNTTPESLELQKVFHKMLEEGVDVAMMEVSSHALHLGRVRGCDFNIAVFTNLTPDHLDYHQTMEAYLYAKGLLFSQLGNTYSDKLKVAVFNNDDPATVEYDKMTTAHVVTYGIEKQSDVMAKAISLSSQGTSFTLITPKEEIDLHLKLIGKFSVYNALAAATAALAYGIPLTNIKNSLEKVTGVAGRFEAIDVGQPYMVIVDYAHTPDSLENVLTTVNELAKGHVYTIVGCGGDRDKTKRPLMAKIAVEQSHLAIFTSDNPRTESALSIIQDMESGVKGERYEVVIDRKEAIEFAVAKAKPNDVIVIAGKGHETYQIIGKNVYDFDDRLVAKEAILKNVQ